MNSIKINLIGKSLMRSEFNSILKRIEFLSRVENKICGFLGGAEKFKKNFLRCFLENFFPFSQSSKL